jgi:hypothetical protein
VLPLKPGLNGASKASEPSVLAHRSILKVDR